MVWFTILTLGCGAAISVDYQQDESFAVTAIDFSGFRAVEFLADVAAERAQEECYETAYEVSELPCDLDEPSTCFSALYVCDERSSAVATHQG